MRGACSAARAAAEAETYQLVGAVAQAERAHRHQLRAQAAAARIRGPRAAAPGLCTRGAYPAERSGRRLEHGTRRRGCGLGRLWRWWQGSFAAQMSCAIPWNETESLSGVAGGGSRTSLAPVPPCPTLSRSHLPGRWPVGGARTGEGPSRAEGLRDMGSREASVTLLSRARTARVGHKAGCKEKRGNSGKHRALRKAVLSVAQIKDRSCWVPI